MDYFMPTRLHTGTDCIVKHADALRAWAAAAPS
jgi:hypothetical protein